MTETDDLTTGEEEFEEGEMETTSRSEYISCAYYALDVIGSMNVMSREDAEIKASVQRKSLKIIDLLITEMYDELFDV